MGELGWELYVPSEFATGLFDTLLAHGEPHGLKLGGMHAMDSLRIREGLSPIGATTSLMRIRRWRRASASPSPSTRTPISSAATPC